MFREFFLNVFPVGFYCFSEKTGRNPEVSTVKTAGEQSRDLVYPTTGE